MASANLLFESKRHYRDGKLAQTRIWIVPQPVRGLIHPYKYSLFYGGPDGRLVGYDNEAGKGDHRHIEGREEPYAFTSVEQLVADFLADVANVRGGDI